MVDNLREQMSQWNLSLNDVLNKNKEKMRKIVEDIHAETEKLSHK
jgi:hypothetical protein